MAISRSNAAKYRQLVARLTRSFARQLYDKGLARLDKRKISPANISPEILQQVLERSLNDDADMPLKERLFTSVTFANRPNYSPLQLSLPRNRADTINLIRYKIALKYPQLMENIKAYEEQAAFGRCLSLKKAALQDEIHAIGAGRLLKVSGISSYQLKHFSGSYARALAESFPLLSLRFEPLDVNQKWTDRKKIRAEIRKRIFLAHPELKTEVETIESQITNEEIPDRRQFNRLRSRLTRLTSRDLISAGLEYIYRISLNGTTPDVVADIIMLGFPLLDPGKRIYYLGEYNLADLRDLKEIMDRFIRHFEVKQPEELVLNGRPRITMTLPDGTRISLRKVLTRLSEHVIPETWHFIRINGHKIPALTNAQALDLVLEFICCKQRTLQRLYDDFMFIRRNVGYFSADMPQLNSRFAMKYGNRAVEYIFDLPFSEVIIGIRQGRPLELMTKNS